MHHRAIVPFDLAHAVRNQLGAALARLRKQKAIQADAEEGLVLARACAAIDAEDAPPGIGLLDGGDLSVDVDDVSAQLGLDDFGGSVIPNDREAAHQAGGQDAGAAFAAFAPRA